MTNDLKKDGWMQKMVRVLSNIFLILFCVDDPDKIKR